MTKLLKKLFTRGKGHYDAIAAVKDDFEWVYNPAAPYHVQVDGMAGSCRGRKTTSCPGGAQPYTDQDKFERRSTKTAYCKPHYSNERYCNSESSVYGSVEASLPEALPSACCTQNDVNERIAVLEAKLQMCRVRLRLEIEKKRRYKEKLLAEREMREASESIHLREIMRLKRERQNLLINKYVVEQKYCRF